MGSSVFVALDHVQLAMPVGGEEAARQFYGSVLGMVEVPKPVELAERGGVWFSSGSVHVHLGVEAEFRPARKAHPALVCRDYSGLLTKLEAAGITVAPAADIPGVRRCHVSDPFGNRIELISS